MKLKTSLLGGFGKILIIVMAFQAATFTPPGPKNVSASIAPELPRTYVDTSFPAQSSSRRIISVASSCAGRSNCYTALQAAIDAANLGDEVVVDAGMRIMGPITLREKTSGSGWIVIRTSNLAGIPQPGTRVTPAHAQAMPKIIAPGSNQSALVTADRAHNYRLIGIELTETANDDSNVIVHLGISRSLCATSAEPYKICTDQSLLNHYPYNLVLDRVYVHGLPTHNVKRGVELNSKAAAVIDSYISDIHVVGQDSQAIGGFNGPGPYKIVNNYLEASTENIIFGGSDPRIQGLIPADIEIRK
ncbi:MAG TPA: hypothetical protein VD998_02930, partial [Verrucomicrobiae bacterium]|nr:hypothetical protein [Verrucomicrobiae bacterium]